MTNKERVLRILSDQIKKGIKPKKRGLGYNELKLKVYEKSLRKWLPLLLKENLIRIEKIPVRGGQKKLHIITDKGREYVKRRRIVYQLERMIEEFDKLSRFDKLKAISKIVRDVYEVFVWHGSLDDVRNFHEAIENEVKDFLNNDLFDLKKKEMVALFKFKDMEQRGFGGWYHDPSYGTRVMRVGFILKDSKIAWELGHYLNSHHVYLLTKLGIIPLTKIENRNKKWLQEHELSRYDDIRQEMVQRIELFKGRFPEFINFVPSDYGIFSKDMR